LSAEQLIRFEGKIVVDPAADFKVIPRDFCITSDGIFVFPDYGAGNVKLLYKDGNSLKFLRNIGEKYGEEGFARPMYCLYKEDVNFTKLGIIDYGAKSLFVFERTGKDEFEKLKTVNCPGLGYDMEFAEDGEQLLVSGYTTDSRNNPYDLYTVNIRSNKINYLLASHRKYYLDSHEAYQREFFDNQSLPAIGKQAFCDIQGDNVFYAWQGALKFIRIHLPTKEITVFGDKLARDVDAEKELGALYKAGNFDEARTLREKRPFVKDIFAARGHVYLVYRPANSSSLKLLAYTPEGRYVGDVNIPRNPGTPMFLDKKSSELYALSKVPDNNKEKFVVLKYKINTK
jgi:hypothetical protein